MSDQARATYRRLVIAGRINAAFFLIAWGLLYILKEDRNPSLYLLTFVFFALSGWGIFAFGFYIWRYAKKHGVAHSL